MHIDYFKLWIVVSLLISLVVCYCVTVYTISDWQSLPEASTRLANGVIMLVPPSSVACKFQSKENLFLAENKVGRWDPFILESEDCLFVLCVSLGYVWASSFYAFLWVMYGLTSLGSLNTSAALGHFYACGHVAL